MNKLAWLEQLVAVDTTSRNSNLELINLISEWLSKHHILFTLTQEVGVAKANLFATIPAQDGNVNGGIILSGHTDVVPVDGQQWDTDPFKATQIEDKIYGRGTCDMKGFIAVVLALVPELQKLLLQQPIHLAFSYDEEVGCRGAPLLIKDLARRGINPNACVVGEPSNMRPVVAHKGIQLFRCRVKGNTAHSSLTPQGCNAIEYAAQLISYIRTFANEIRAKGPFDAHFDVPFTSISTNMIEGGIAHNIIPALCEFYFEFRHLPEVNPASIISRITNHVQTNLLPQMQQEFPQAAVELDYVGSVPAFESVANSEIYQHARAITGVDEILKVAYATEAGLFQGANIPTIICGPGSIEQAHRANEFVLIEQLDQCEVFLLELARKFCSRT